MFRDIRHRSVYLYDILRITTMDMEFRLRRQQPIKVAPRQQFAHIRVILNRLMTNNIIEMRCVIIEIPTVKIGTAIIHMHQREIGFRQVRRN